LDLIADAGLVLGLAREVALDEPPSFLLHALHRHSLLEALRIKNHARATFVALQARNGDSAAHRALMDFYGEMEAVIARDPFATAEDHEAAQHAAAIAAFDAIAARARRSSRR
jgi:hypothetical protein